MNLVYIHAPEPHNHLAPPSPSRHTVHTNPSRTTRTRPVRPLNAPFLRRCLPPQNCTSWAWRTKSIAKECRRDRSRERRACANSGITGRCCENFQNGHPQNSSVLYIRREDKFGGWIWSRVGAEVGGVGRCRRTAVGENSKSGGSGNPWLGIGGERAGKWRVGRGGLVGVYQVYCFDTLP